MCADVPAVAVDDAVAAGAADVAAPADAAGADENSGLHGLGE